VELKSLALESYTQTQILLRVRGKLNLEAVLDSNPIRFHPDVDCKSKVLGSGTHAEFRDSGIQLELTADQPTEIFISGVAFAGCFYLTTYRPEFPKPVNPKFRSSVPQSPSGESFTPIFFGDHSSLGFKLEFFFDSSCQTPISETTTEKIAQQGYRLPVPKNAITNVYTKVTEPFGQTSPCELFTTYQHSNSGPSAPQFLSSDPVSPSRLSRKPLLKATLSEGTEKVRFYSDLNCSVLLAETSASLLTSAGAEVEVSAEVETKIYALALDQEDKASPCELFLIYQHDTVPPEGPTYLSAFPSSPTRLSIYPQIKGTLPADAAMIKFFKNLTCTEQIGSGTRLEYVGTGATASVTPNSTTEIYGQAFDAAGNSSDCVFLLSYRHNTIPPDPPVFSATLPLSPNNFSTTPSIFGNASDRSEELFFYSDESCTVLLGSGPAEDFAEIGIPVVVPDNATTTIHATAKDEEGNISSCAVLVNYAHSTLPAPAPVFAMAVPSSPTRVTNMPYILGTADATVTTVSLFTDSLCTAAAGSANRIMFESSGVQVTIPINAVTDIYGISADVFGNFSGCTFITSYTHNTIPPFNPTFSALSPLSPNNFSVTPTITGTTSKDPLSVLEPTTVSLYDSFLCLNRIGTNTTTNFASTGILLGVPENAVTNIYGKVFDAAGNQSACTYLTDYIHSNRKPGKPQFLAALPATPSYTSTTKISGNLGTTLDFLPIQDISIFKDSLCTDLLASGSESSFLSTGIEISVPVNATTPLFARATNVVGTKSDCNPLVDYRHTDIGATSLNAFVQPDGSVNLTWTPDLIAAPTAKYTIKRSLTAGGPYAIIQNELSGSSFKDRAVSYGKTYYYRIAAGNNTGISKDTAEVSSNVNSATPNQPISLVALAGASQVTLSWVGFSVNMFYQVLRSTTSGGPYTTVARDLTSSVYVDLGLTNETAYYYKVIGTNTRGVSLESQETNAIPLEAPAAPTGLSATMLAATPACAGAAGILVSWSPTSHFQSFNLKRGSYITPSYNLANVTTPYYTDCAPLTTDNNYRVTTLWGSFESAASNVVTVDGSASSALLSFPGDSQMLLSWSPVTAADLTHYRIERSLFPDGPFTVLNPTVYANHYADYAVTNGTAYFYRVIPVFSFGGEGFPTSVISGVPNVNPGAPNHLTLVVNSSGQPEMTWASSVYANGYRIYRASSAGGPFTELTFTTTATYTDSSPLVGMNYYQVKAAWGSHTTSATNTVSFRKGDISSLTVTGAASQINLSWSAVSGGTDYSIYRGTTAGGPYGLLTTAGTNSFADTTAVGGVGYFYVVRANFADGTQGNSSTEGSGMKTGTNVPSGLTIIGATTTSLNLKWAKVNAATDYEIYTSLTSGAGFTLAATTGSTSYSLNFLNPSTRYYIRMKAIVGGNTSGNSVEISGYTFAKPSTPTVIPGPNSVAISWTSLVGATSYNIERSTDALNFSTIASGVSTISYVDSTAVNGNLYFYQVTAVYPPYNLTSVPSLGVSPGAVPSAPSGLQVTLNTTGTDVELGFATVSRASSYNIYYGTVQGGPYPNVLQTSSNLAVPILGLTAGVTHYLVVKALIGSVESAASSELAFVPFLAPGAPTVFATTDTQVDVSWSAVAGASTYKVERSRNEVVFQELVSGHAGTTFADSTAIAGESYTYRYVPVNAAGIEFAKSLLSIRVSPGVRPNAPTAVKAEATDVPSVRLSWVSTSNTIAYRIYRSPSGAGSYGLVDSVFFPAITYEDTSAILGVSYDYLIRSVSSHATESLDSNVASVTLTDAPTGLVINVLNGQLDLSWSAVPGAVSYTIRKSVQSGTGFGVIASGVAGTSFSDNAVFDGVRYYYVVQANFPAGVQSLNSSEISALAILNLNLEVPIELIDRGIVSKVTPITFQRSTTSVEPSAYNGTVSYFLEVYASNKGASPTAIELIDQDSNLLGSLTVPGSSTQPGRIRASISAPSGDGSVRLRLPGTAQDGDLEVHSARLLIQQIGASKTKIYYPMLNSQQAPTSEDEVGWAEDSSSSTFSNLSTSSIFRKASADWSVLSFTNPYELEIVAKRMGPAESLIGLRNTTTGNPVGYSRTQINSDGWKLARAPFGEGADQFGSSNEGHEYQIAVQCQYNCLAGSLQVHRAGLWIRIEQLTKAVVPYRMIRGQNLTASQFSDSHRTRMDLSLFSNPTVYFQAIGSTSDLGLLGLELLTFGTAETGSGSSSAIAESKLELSGSAKNLRRTLAPISIVSDDRFSVTRDATNGTLNLVDSLLLIHISK